MNKVMEQISGTCLAHHMSLVSLRMGYISVKKCESRVHDVLSSQSLGHLNFDGLYSSEGFLNKLLEGQARRS